MEGKREGRSKKERVFYDAYSFFPFARLGLRLGHLNRKKSWKNQDDLQKSSK
tara:strand:- start:731 stop:886 length:156 start_codon:yes stop_codon:yes gene_type:complete